VRRNRWIWINNKTRYKFSQMILHKFSWCMQNYRHSLPLRHIATTTDPRMMRAWSPTFTSMEIVAFRPTRDSPNSAVPLITHRRNQTFAPFWPHGYMHLTLDFVLSPIIVSSHGRESGNISVLLDFNIFPFTNTPQCVTGKIPQTSSDGTLTRPSKNITIEYTVISDFHIPWFEQRFEDGVVPMWYSPNPVRIGDMTAFLPIFTVLPPADSDPKYLHWLFF
jgi:hypothetical protein